MATSDKGIFGEEARGLGKSARTRARLMDAAVAVFARRGIEAASVNEIAQEADVANGTFYNYYRDKDAIVGEVAFRIAGDMARHIDQALATVTSAPERCSFATRQFIELAAVVPEWGWAFLRAVWYLPELRRQVSSYARADIERGVRDGDFKIEVDDFTIDVYASMVVTAVFSRLRGETGPEAGSKTAELQLRMLGVPAARARGIAWREIEILPFEHSPANIAIARS